MIYPKPDSIYLRWIIGLANTLLAPVVMESQDGCSFQGHMWVLGHKGVDAWVPFPNKKS